MALSDESLVAGMAAEDSDAAAAFVRRFQSRVFGLAVSVVGSPELAEEVAQDAFFKAWRAAAAYDPRRGRVSTWLLTITRNAAVDALRMRREPPMDPDMLLALLAARETDETSSDGETSARLQEALRDLPAEQAKPVVMMTFYGLTAAEIATRDDVPLGTVKTRIRRGLQAMRNRMGQMGASDV
jgi:RNA polymerase sigma-70 factor (ECF subfamily)